MCNSRTRPPIRRLNIHRAFLQIGDGTLSSLARGPSATSICNYLITLAFERTDLGLSRVVGIKNYNTSCSRSGRYTGYGGGSLIGFTLPTPLLVLSYGWLKGFLTFV